MRLEEYGELEAYLEPEGWEPPEALTPEQILRLAAGETGAEVAPMEERDLVDIKASFERREDGSATVVAELGDAKITFEWAEGYEDAIETIMEATPQIFENVSAAVAAADAESEEE